MIGCWRGEFLLCKDWAVWLLAGVFLLLGVLLLAVGLWAVGAGTILGRCVRLAVFVGARGTLARGRFLLALVVVVLGRGLCGAWYSLCGA